MQTQTLIKECINKLTNRKKLHLYRHRTKILDRKAAYFFYKKNQYLSFQNNDYLGLATHPLIIKAFKEAADRYGVGSSASQLLGGHYHVHHELEEALADFLGQERVLLFSTGYMANLAALVTLLNKQDWVFQDRLAHASLIDGARFCFAHFKRYPHRDHNVLTQYLISVINENKWIVTDGVFSMNGDIADLPELVDIAKKTSSHLYIDDAHGIGVLGKSGKGSIEHHQIKAEDVTILVGTFGKAFGTAGACIAGKNILIEVLLQFARSYIYTTAMPPALACATYASLKLIQKENWRRDYLRHLINRFKQGAKTINLPLLPSITPIQVIMLDCSLKTQKVAKTLSKYGILVGSIRPPTVPPYKACLRINLTANHTEKDIDYLLEVLEKKQIFHGSN
jgi:8-amino-7-oxononanoate synthase